MNDVEHLIASCPDCANTGMVDGERCQTCNGQGFVRDAERAAAQRTERVERQAAAEARVAAKRATLGLAPDPRPRPRRTADRAGEGHR